MKSLSATQLILSTGLTLMLITGGQFFLNSQKQNQIDEAMEGHIDRVQTAYDTVLQTFQIAGQKDLFNIVQDPKVLGLLSDFKHADQNRQAELRGLLYRSLISNYTFMKELGVRQFHFHTHQGKSLLRFHRPSKNGDPLMDIRASIRIANTQHKAVIGFEGGRIFPGFRYVFPIIHNQEHLGSVEFSVSFEAVEQKLSHIVPSLATQLTMNAKNSYDLAFSQIKDYLKPTEFDAHYYIESPKLSQLNRTIESNLTIKNIQTQLKKVQQLPQQLATLAPFYVPVTLGQETYMVTFVPFKNVVGEHAGYINTYQKFEKMEQIEHTHFIFQSILLVLALIFFTLFNIIWSQRRRALGLKKELIRNNHIMEEAQKIAHFGYWEWSVTDNRITWSNEARHIIGSSNTNPPLTFEDFLNLVPSEDRTRVNQAFQASIENKKQYFCEHKVIVPSDRTMRVIEAYGSHQFDENGQHITSVGTLYNVTKRSNAFNHLKKIIDIQKSIAVVTNGTTFNFANQSFLKFFGYETIEAFKNHHRCICDRFINKLPFFSLNEVKSNEAHWVESLLNRSARERIVMMNDFLERPRAFSVSISEFDDHAYMVLFTDITDTMKEKMELQNQLNKDELTQVYNRHFLLHNKQNMIEKIEHYNQEKAFLFYLDIDHFKPINDRYGHAIGDQVLTQFAHIIASILRDDDFLIRLGGEEFLIILGCHNQNNAKAKANRILNTVNRHPFEIVGQITCSIGVTALQKGEQLDQAIKRADENMYQAKQTGRNRYIIDPTI